VFFKAERKTGLAKTLAYQRKDNPRMGKLRAGELLKEKSTMIKIGKNK
jgi:hypothetical protein